MRISIWFSCKVASKIICVSQNTKNDVLRLYGVQQDKISVVYEGYEKKYIENSIQSSSLSKQDSLVKKPYILFIGRLEERKNIIRYIQAFEIFKKKYHSEHKLVFAGKPGYGYVSIQESILKSVYREDIITLGFVSEEEKWRLLHDADIFLFATLYEGFGIPVLEAQSMGISVITSKTSSLPEVAVDGALLVDPVDIQEISVAIHSIISNKTFKDAIIAKGYENVKRFSWEQCAQELGGILKER